MLPVVRQFRDGITDVIQRAMARDPEDAILLVDAGHAVLERTGVKAGGELAYAEAVLAYRDRISTAPAGDAARARVAHSR